MEDNKITELLIQIKDKYPSDKLPIMKDKLKTADESKVNQVLMMKTHNPIAVLLFSIFLGGFGIDRFILGDVGLGIAKLLLGWATCGIWPLIDIFFSYQRAKEKNFENFMTLI